MLNRCLNPRYSGERCTVCEEWKRLSAFKEWFNKHYVDGWELDRRLLKDGNREYGPDTCVFLPRSVENLLETGGHRRGGLPLGVSRLPRGEGRFRAMIKIDGEVRHLGCFDDIESARRAYMGEKMRVMALRYMDRLETRAFDAMYGWKKSGRK